jgi:2-amino-4-hydroxy-6-hydroxymethyldihydropteridine diphosphokinase
MNSVSRERAYIGIGSNLEDPLGQVQSAVEALASLPETQFVQHSPWYRSKAIGPGDQPDYINGVAEVDTGLSPQQLLTALHAIEMAQGRIRHQRWAARTLDLDILLYGNRIVATDRLRIPHPRLHQRNFVLYPLADLTPQLMFPDGRSLASLVAKCSNIDIEKL